MAWFPLQFPPETANLWTVRRTLRLVSRYPQRQDSPNGAIIPALCTETATNAFGNRAGIKAMLDSGRAHVRIGPVAHPKAPLRVSTRRTAVRQRPSLGIVRRHNSAQVCGLPKPLMRMNLPVITTFNKRHIAVRCGASGKPQLTRLTIDPAENKPRVSAQDWVSSDARNPQQAHGLLSASVQQVSFVLARSSPMQDSKPTVLVGFRPGVQPSDTGLRP